MFAFGFRFCYCLLFDVTGLLDDCWLLVLILVVGACCVVCLDLWFICGVDDALVAVILDLFGVGLFRLG